tara:strand:+ start:11762 stop:12721 length:960 start_codon:yes stop_codon:yes gene_type:complete
MISRTRIEFLRGGLVTSLQGNSINNLQHLGITTSGPMDYFLSKIGNLIMDNKEDDLTFEICKFGPKIKIIEGNFIFLISGKVNFKIVSNCSTIVGKCFKSYVLKKGDVLELNQTVNSNYAYLIFKGNLKIDNSYNYNSSILSSLLGINDGKKINDLDKFTIIDVPSFNERSFPFPLKDIYDNKIRVIKGPQMNYFKISMIDKFFSKKFKISENINRVGIRLIENQIKPIISMNMPSEGINKGAIQIPGDGNPIVLASEHPTIGGYPKIATIIIADLFKLLQLEEGSEFNFQEIDINSAEKLYLDFNDFIKSIQNKIVYL